jgi:ring-1,2-phenylacetyl-CoA epoxidase subunit PaaB
MSNPLQSLDPRINRLGVHEVTPETLVPKTGLDQFETYEAFLQKREGAKYEHVGPVHAPNEEMAFLFAKEQYSRRMTCVGLFVVKTDQILTTPFGPNDNSIYDLLPTDNEVVSGDPQVWEVFHLKKRGIQHHHVGSVSAPSAIVALTLAKETYGAERPVVNVWIIPESQIRFTSSEEKAIWDTLKDKKYRDAISYKVQDRIDRYKQGHPNLQSI